MLINAYSFYKISAPIRRIRVSPRPIFLALVIETLI